MQVNAKFIPNKEDKEVEGMEIYWIISELFTESAFKNCIFYRLHIFGFVQSGNEKWKNWRKRLLRYI
jgi:hypothetical protein